MIYKILVQSKYVYKGLFYWNTWTAYVPNVVLRPIMFTLMFILLGRLTINEEAATLYVLGLALYSMSFIIIYGITQSFDMERRIGTLPFIFISSGKRFGNYLSRSILHIPNGLISFFIAVGFSFTLIDMNFESTNWLGFLVSICIVSLSLAAFGKFLGILSIIFQDWGNIAVVSTAFFLLCTGAVIPLTNYPEWFQPIPYFFPMTNSIVALHGLINGDSLSSVSLNIVRECLLLLGYLLLGYIGLLYIEKISKQKGTI